MPAAMQKTFYVYILAGKSGVLYTGMTNSLTRRLWEHQQKRLESFTKHYNVAKLVWFELHAGPKSAIEREKEIKAWRRSKKVALIQSTNPAWHDLSETLA
jgi:putative endonuclease